MPEDLPPVSPGPSPMVPPLGQPGMRPQTAPQQPVGRPSGDPEVQQARVEKHQRRSRLEAILPRVATDEKIKVFKKRDGRVMPGSKPVLVVLASDLEKARDDGTAPEDYIFTKLGTKFDKGKFECQTYDRSDRRLSEYPAWEVSLDDEDLAGDDEDLDDGAEEVELQRPPFSDLDEGYQSRAPVYAAPVQPPAAPALDPLALASTMRNERNDEAKRGGDQMAMMLSMMTSQNQLMLQQQEQSRRENAEREERIRRENMEREERERIRREDKTKTLLTLLPLAMPFLERLFKREPDPMLAQLLGAVLNKSGEGDLMKQYASMMSEGAKTQLQLQSAGVQSAMQMQAEMSGVVVKTAMNQMKELMGSRSEAPKEESTMSQIAQIAGAVMPALMQQQQAQPAPTFAPQEQPAALPVPAAEAPAPMPPPEHHRRRKLPPPPPPEQPAAAAEAPPAPADTPDAKRVLGVLRTVNGLYNGKVKATQRWDALRWCCKNMPTSMRTAIAANNRDEVIKLAAPVVMQDPDLMGWVASETGQAFLAAAVADMHALLTNTLTPGHAQQAIDANMTLQGLKPVAPATAPAVAEAPAAGKPRKVKVAPPAAVVAAEPASGSPQAVQVTLPNGGVATVIDEPLRPDAAQLMKAAEGAQEPPRAENPPTTAPDAPAEPVSGPRRRSWKTRRPAGTAPVSAQEPPAANG